MTTSEWMVMVFVPVIVAALGSSWLGDFFAKRRESKISNDELLNAINRVDKKVDDNDERYERDKAESKRTQILRFDDELRLGTRHSYEYFEVILNTVKEYEDYCDTHPNFKNRQAVSAIDHIQKAYDKCHNDNDFL